MKPGLEHAVDAPGGAGPRWERTGAILALLVVLLLASLPFTVHGGYEASNDTNDAAMYVLCARSLLAGEGYAYLGEPFAIRPPGFSVLIAPVIAIAGTSFRALHLLVSLFGVAACALLFAWSRARLGTWLALALALATWVNPAFQLYCNRVLSDVPGAALTFACLLVARWADRAPSAQRDALLGAAIGLSSYVRSIAILLVPAILLARLLERSRSGERTPLLGFTRARLLVVLIVPALLLLPWKLRNDAVRAPPPAEQNYIYSYSTAMWHQDGGDPSSPRRPASEILGRVPGRVSELLSLFGGRMDPDGKSPLSLALGGIFLAGAAITLVRRREAAELFLFACIGVLLVYFGFKDRLALPVWLLALPSAAEGLAFALGRVTGLARARAVLAVAVVALAVVDLDWTSDRKRAELTDGLYGSICRDFDAHLPRGARVAAPIGWHYSVYLDRPVYSLFFAVRRANDMAAAERVIDEEAIEFVVLSPRVPADHAMLPYFLEKHGPPAGTGDALVFAVRPPRDAARPEPGPTDPMREDGR